MHPILRSKYPHPLFNVPLLTALMAPSKLFSWFAGGTSRKSSNRLGVGAKSAKIPTAFRTKKPTFFSSKSASNTQILKSSTGYGPSEASCLGVISSNPESRLIWPSYIRLICTQLFVFRYCNKSDVTPPPS